MYSGLSSTARVRYRSASLPTGQVHDVGSEEGLCHKTLDEGESPHPVIENPKSVVGAGMQGIHLQDLMGQVVYLLTECRRFSSPRLDGSETLGAQQPVQPLEIFRLDLGGPTSVGLRDLVPLILYPPPLGEEPLSDGRAGRGPQRFEDLRIIVDDVLEELQGLHDPMVEEEVVRL